MKICRPDSAEIVGHLPMKISRITKFIIDRGAKCTLNIPGMCNTLLVPPEKLVPPCGFGRYPLNQYFRHTEAQPKRFGSFVNQGIRLVDVIIKIQKEIQTLRKSK